MARAWFAYLGQGNGLLPENYLYSLNSPTCVNGRIICAIYAPYNGTQLPAFISPNLATYIATGKTTGIAQPQTPIGFAKFVYYLPVQ